MKYNFNLFRMIERIQAKKCTLKSFVSQGPAFTVLAMVFGALAVGFYANRAQSRNLSPAESRNLNSECIFLDFFDSHDVWHFFSASAVFMVFLGLLVIDDDLLTQPRHRIRVF